MTPEIGFAQPVGQEEIDRAVPIQDAERLRRVGDADRVVAEFLQSLDHIGADLGIVFRDEDGLARPAPACVRGAAGGGGDAARRRGRYIFTVVPRPSSL